MKQANRHHKKLQTPANQTKWIKTQMSADTILAHSTGSISLPLQWSRISPNLSLIHTCYNWTYPFQVFNSSTILYFSFDRRHRTSIRDVLASSESRRRIAWRTPSPVSCKVAKIFSFFNHHQQKPISLWPISPSCSPPSSSCSVAHQQQQVQA